MKRGRGVAVLAVVVIFLALAASVAVRRAMSISEIARRSAGEGGGRLSVGVAAITNRSVLLRVSLTGEIESPCVVDVVSKAAGKLEAMRRPDGLPLREGDVLAAGDVVAVVEHGALEAMAGQAEAALNVARSAEEQASLGAAQAAREHARMEALHRDGSATEQQLQQAATARDMSAAALRLAQAQVAQAGAALRLARLNLADARIAAPIAGTVAQKYVDEGNMVGPGRPLLRLMSMKEVDAAGEVPDIYLPLLRSGGTEAEVRVDAYPDRLFAARLSVVSPDVNRFTRTVGVKATLGNEAGLLKPGMFARMSLLLDRRENVAAIPDAAIVRSDRGIHAYVVEDGIARRRELILGISDGVVHEVISGVNAGENVIVRGRQSVADGEQVTAVPEGVR